MRKPTLKSNSFFRSSAESVIRQQGLFSLTNGRHRLYNEDHESQWTGLPYLYREEFLDARDSDKERMIKSVQRALDTAAAQAAVIADCESKTSDGVTACGLSYYDRRLARITASARKEYAVGIVDATRWAEPLARSLKTGLDSAESPREILPST